MYQTPRTRWEYVLHLTPSMRVVRAAVMEVEQTFSSQVFAPGARGLTDGFRLLRRLQTAEHWWIFLAIRMLSRAKAKKMASMSQPRDRRELHELLRIIRDIASMLDREPFEKALEHLNKKLTTGRLYEMFTIQEAEQLERQIPYDRPNELPAIYRRILL